MQTHQSLVFLTSHWYLESKKVWYEMNCDVLICSFLFVGINGFEDPHKNKHLSLRFILEDPVWRHTFPSLHNKRRHKNARGLELVHPVCSPHPVIRRPEAHSSAFAEMLPFRARVTALWKPGQEVWPSLQQQPHFEDKKQKLLHLLKTWAFVLDFIPP